MSAAWNVTLPPVEKLVLLALADWANDDGACWPSIKKLVEKTDASERTVQRAISSLASKGQLTRSEVAGKGVNYTIHPRQIDTPVTVTPASNPTQTPVTVTPNTSVTTTFEKDKSFSVRDAFLAWNETAKKTGLPVAKDLTPQRSKHIAARLRAVGEAGWREALAAVEASPLCLGDNERGWRADLDFVCQAKSFSKLREGSYAPRVVATGPPVTVDPARVAAMTADFKARQRAYLDELDAADASH